MNFNEYQEIANEIAFYPNRGQNLQYTVLGLCGESGEVAEKLKKLIRDTEGNQTNQFNQELLKELGDSLWYISQCAYEIGFTLEDVAKANIAKLNSRKERGVLSGSGDNR